MALEYADLTVALMCKMYFEMLFIGYHCAILAALNDYLYSHSLKFCKHCKLDKCVWNVNVWMSESNVKLFH